MAAKHVSLPSVFAEGNPTEWFRWFDICCAANEWENETKAHSTRRGSTGCLVRVHARRAERFQSCQEEDHWSDGTFVICVFGRFSGMTAVTGCVALGVCP